LIKKDSADLVSQQSTNFDAHSLKEIEGMPPLQSASDLRDFSELLRQEKKTRVEPALVDSIPKLTAGVAQEA
jgi:hypothetical protein